jgi:hypothetical protein
MKLKTASKKQIKPKTLLAEEYERGICAPDTSEAVYKVIDSDNVLADPVTKKPRRTGGENVRTRKD